MDNLARTGSVELSGQSNIYTSPDRSKPASAVPDAAGAIGLAGLTISLLCSHFLQLSLGAAALVLLTGCAAPMILYDLLYRKVYLEQTAGMDFGRADSDADDIGICRVKLIGLYVTFVFIISVYFLLRYYHSEQFYFYYSLLTTFSVSIFVLAIPYVFMVNKYQKQKKDTLWHFGSFVLGRMGAVDRDLVLDHIRCWAIKGFFLAFMFSILPNLVYAVLHPGHPLHDPAAIVTWLISLTYLVDVTFGTLGYICTFRVLDSHIRSANPYFDSWVWALMCYPPVALMMSGQVLNYKAGGLHFTDWFSAHPALLAGWAIPIVILSAVYAWSTVVFGIRFSNLTDRGIITTGPYRWSKHPAYICKNISWWFIFLPFLSVTGFQDAIRNSILLLAVNFIYFMRAKTEERHLLANPEYRAYSEWIAGNGLISRTRWYLTSGAKA